MSDTEDTRPWITNPDGKPEEGDILSPWHCDKCYSEHPMKWAENHLSGGMFVMCYRCDNFVFPTTYEKVVR
jgi:hypothetical protein